MLLHFGSKLILAVLLFYGVFARNADREENYERGQKRFNGGSMLTGIAKEIIERSGSSSQVLNLNLSNLFILLILKAIVFGAGYLGNQGHKARDLMPDDVVSEGEMTLALGFLLGDSCLYRAACEDPYTAKGYLDAAEILMQTTKLMPQSTTYQAKYEKTMSEFRKAIDYGMTHQCPSEYVCKKDNIANFLKPK